MHKPRLYATIATLIAAAMLASGFALGGCSKDTGGGSSGSGGIGRFLGGGAGKKNVILITLDTLRADHLPAYGYDKVETPTLDAIVKSGVKFGNASAHGPLTLPSHTSILTGTNPIFHGVRNNGEFYADEKLNTMAEMFKAEGYDTAAFVGSFVLDSRFGLDQGFDHYDDDMVDGRQKHSQFEFKDRIAENVLGRVRAWFDGRVSQKKDAPFYLWVHLYDPHKEYEPQEPFRTKYADNLYDGEIAYTDSQLGIFFDYLKKQGIYDDTMIVITADHGESLGEHEESTHSIFIYNATTWVPLMIKFPGDKYAGNTVGPLVRHIDIIPTVLDYLGLRKSLDEKKLSADLQGASLMQLVENPSAPDPGFYCYAESYLPKYYYNWSPPESLRTTEFRYINLPKAEFYDLHADPNELKNVYDESDNKVKKFVRALRDMKQELGRGEAAETRRKMDEETIAKLKSLGYIQGTADVTKQSDEPGPDPKDMIKDQEEMSLVHNLINNKRFDEAIQRVERMLKNNPKNLQARNSYAISLMRKGDVDGAIKQYHQMKKIDPTFLSAYLGLCSIYTKKRPDFKLAEKELEAAMAISPDDPSLLIVKGDLEQEQGRMKESLEFYLKAREQGDQSAPLFVGLGSAYNKLDKIPEATEALERAIYIDNDNSEALYNLGVVLERQNKPQEAEKRYREAIQADAENHYAYTNLGSLQTKMQQFEPAMKNFKRALEIEPNHVEALYNMGTVMLNVGKLKEAIPYFKKSIELRPNLFFAYNNLSLAYEKLGQVNDSINVFAKLNKAAPNEPMPLYRMAQIAARNGRKADARKYLQQALTLGGERLREQADKDPQMRELM